MKTFKLSALLAMLVMLTPILSMAQVVTLEFKNAATALEVAQNYSKALQAGDVTKMDAQLAPGAMVYGLNGALDSLTKAAHKEYYTTSTGTYKHTLTNELFLPVKVTDNWNEGEWVLGWGTNTITDKATGKTLAVPYHTASLIMNGKVVRMNYWYDRVNIMAMQGYQMIPPSN
jgi:hypothetical protein